MSSESREAGARQGGGSSISCECQQSAGRRRCSASPETEGREGKENEDWDACGVNRSLDRQQLASPECEDSGGPVFPDDDSNQILPVEHFFGNMDIVQVRRRRVPLLGICLSLTKIHYFHCIDQRISSTSIDGYKKCLFGRVCLAGLSSEGTEDVQGHSEAEQTTAFLCSRGQRRRRGHLTGAGGTFLPFST